MYGDFEDLETGEKHGSSAAKESAEDGQGESLEDEEIVEQKRLKKKKSLKVAFDVEYDDKTGGEGGYLEDLKREVSEQEQRNRAEFEGLDEQTRVQYEGFRPGTYVRMEIKGTHNLNYKYTAKSYFLLIVIWKSNQKKSYLVHVAGQTVSTFDLN